VSLADTRPARILSLADLGGLFRQIPCILVLRTGRASFMLRSGTSPPQDKLLQGFQSPLLRPRYPNHLPSSHHQYHRFKHHLSVLRHHSLQQYHHHLRPFISNILPPYHSSNPQRPASPSRQVSLQPPSMSSQSSTFSPLYIPSNGNKPSTTSTPCANSPCWP